MYITKEAVQKILGIKEEVPLLPEHMASTIAITFFPHDKNKVSKEIEEFGNKLHLALNKLGVKLVPFEESFIPFPRIKLIKIYLLLFVGLLVAPWRKVMKTHNRLDRLNFDVISKIKRGRRIKPGISVVALGEQETGNLPMDYTISFTRSSVISILDMPDYINGETEFHEHFDTAMHLFSHNMTNIAIIVNKTKWILYNFNASHPAYSIDENFEHNILHSLIPKIAAPIKPPKLSEFILVSDAFDPYDTFHKPFTLDLSENGHLFEKTKLYPPGKKLSEMSFRNDFYQWVGKIHLDNRSGMSYGFLARQLPVKLSSIIETKDGEKMFGDKIYSPDGYFYDGNKLYITITTAKGKFYITPPEVWVLTQRSGSNKTKMDPLKDTIKLGLVGGVMVMTAPKGLKITPDYKPSFDTRVILAHAVSNAIIASIQKYFDKQSSFAHTMETSGLALSHWHGYFNPNLIPKGWHVHGLDNAPVPCSSPQSAFYAFDGNIKVFMKALENNDDYLGNIHIEPHHGTNISFPSLKDLGEFFLSAPNISRLGNYYLDLCK